MALFYFPKYKYVRRLAPRKFKRYQSYKRFLRDEFSRTCVYCRQPDTSAPNLNFGVDHYRPKGLSQFAGLITHYPNLFYCCGGCNSRKGNYWPVNEKNGPFVVNPCDFDMASHLKFNATTCEVEPVGLHGEFTEELLQLNDQDLIKYRKSTLSIIKLLDAKIRLLKSERSVLAKAHQAGKITAAELAQMLSEVDQELRDLEEAAANQSGAVPVMPVPATKLGFEMYAA